MNQPWYIHAMYTIIKPFLKDKTRKRVNVPFLSLFPSSPLLPLSLVSFHCHLFSSQVLWSLIFSSSLFVSSSVRFSCCFFLFIPSFVSFAFFFIPFLCSSPFLVSPPLHLSLLVSSHLLSSSPPQIFLHGNNLNSLHQLIQPECLPSEFGGTLPPYDMGIWARTLLGPDYNDETEYTLTYDALHVRENCGGGGGGGDKDMMKR